MSSFGSWKIPCVYARKKSVAIWNNSALFLSVLMFSESTEDKKKTRLRFEVYEFTFTATDPYKVLYIKSLNRGVENAFSQTFQ